MRDQEQEKRKAWDVALGLIKVDGLEPTAEFKDLVEKEIRGEISDEELLAYVKQRYAEEDAESSGVLDED